MSQTNPATRRNDKILDLLKRMRGEKRPATRDANTIPDHQAHRKVCVNCAYVLHGQQTLHCPECGLWLASCYRDPTPWADACKARADSDGRARPTARLAFLRTILAVVQFDKRIRLRTAMFPCTSDSRRFAFYCCGMAAPLMGILAVLFATEFLDRQGLNPLVFLTGVFVVAATASLVGAAVTLIGLEFVFKGRWKKRRHTFIPSSIHYSFAWLLPAAAMTALSLVLATVFGVPFASAGIPLVGMSVMLWLIWLWDGVSQSARNLNVGVRLACVVFVCLVMIGVVGNLKLRTTSAAGTAGRASSPNPVLATIDWGSTAVQSLATKVTQPPPPVTKTHVVIIDQIKDEDDSLPVSALKKLCRNPDDSFVVLRGKHCTNDEIREVFESVPTWVAPQDRFILYINGHGMQEGNGYVKMNDGWISSQMVQDLFMEVESPDCLLILDSCFSGNFVRSLRDSDCVVVASTDRQNVSFETGLRLLWTSWASVQADVSRDGRIDIEEAFWYSMERIVQKNAKLRAEWLKSNPSVMTRKLMQDAGFASPQFNEFGKADSTKFSIRYR